MKKSEYSVQLIKKNGEVFTRFKIGHNCTTKIKNILVGLNAELVKQTKIYCSYELKGNKMILVALD